MIGRALPTEKERLPALYKMRIFAAEEVSAKSRFWYFIKKLKKIKKTKGEIVSCRKVGELDELTAQPQSPRVRGKSLFLRTLLKNVWK